jgi:hypothetical protein
MRGDVIHNTNTRTGEVSTVPLKNWNIKSLQNTKNIKESKEESCRAAGCVGIQGKREEIYILISKSDLRLSSYQ